ncbi:MAG: hypothetical protein JSU70_15425 [Phycisphaerales bacterium]|nr:MAG: hypothetical protein JSU70_15425 [Phycisphaerales bacterium]
MKIRTSIIAVLGVLVASGFSPAQVMEAPQQEPQEPAIQQSDSPHLPQPEPQLVAQAAPPTPQAPRPLRLDVTRATTQPGVRARSGSAPTEVRIIELKYAEAHSLANLIDSLFGVKVYFDAPSNRLIVNATKEQIEGVMSVIDEMDVPIVEASTARDIQNLVYRVYMFETPSGDQDMKPFSMSLDTTEQVPPQQLLDAVAEKDVEISEFRQIDKGSRSDVLIQGRAASYEALRRMVEKLPESNIDELTWGDDDAETFADRIAAAQYTQLPETMQKHIGKFLGDDIRTVGYWFGNLSAPGEVEAPIGPWTLTLRLDTEADRMLELRVDVEVPGEMRDFDKRLGLQRNDEILSNAISVKIGKPIIIGYNRQSYGTRKMGAMVIVPEVDTAIESL